jgi:hypothetical protein
VAHLEVFSGPLFIDGVAGDDVGQGKLGDCYLAAAVSAIAYMRPLLLAGCFKAHDDRTVSVRIGDEWVRVDRELWVGRKQGKARYGRGQDAAKGKDGMELWFPLLEKACAADKGSYEALEGGTASKVFRLLLDCETTRLNPIKDGFAMLRAKVEEAMAKMQPCVFGTLSKPGPELNGLEEDHFYAVIACKEENGECYVELRNPWGDGEPSDDGKDDGIFWIKLSDLCHACDIFACAELA